MSRYIARGSPVMVQWTAQDGPQYLGLGHPAKQCTVSADFGFNASKHEATLRFRVSVWLKEAQKKVPLYVLVYPNKIQDASVQTQEAPGLVADAFVAEVTQCCSSQDVCAIQILLRDSSAIKIIGPLATKSLTPTNEGYNKILEALRSLSYTTHIIIYLPINLESNPELSSRLGVFCDNAASKSLQTGVNEYALKNLYGGAGGQDISSLLQDTPQSPPSYDEFAPRDPSPEDLHAKRPLSSPSDSSHPSKKPHAPEVPEWWARRLLQVELDMSKVQRRLAEQDAAGSPTEDASVADHFERLDDSARELSTRIDSLQKEMAQQRQQMEQQQEHIEKQQRQIEQQQEHIEKQQRQIEQHQEQLDRRHRQQSQQKEDGDEENEDSAQTPEEEPPTIEDLVENYLFECGFRDKHETVYEIVEESLMDFRHEHEEWLEGQLLDKLPALLRRSLRLILPRALEQVSLRVGLNGRGAGWRWLETGENVRLPGEEVGYSYEDGGDE